MIQANELRIGNWLLFTDFPVYNNPVQVRQGELKQEWLDWFAKPIPLTPEILEKCGFENWDKNKYSNDILCLTINGEGFLYLANQRHVNIFYLHQLQNLYFALTGEELTFKP